MSLYFTQYLPVNIKCAKGNKTGQDHLPGYFAERPFLFNAYA